MLYINKHDNFNDTSILFLLFSPFSTEENCRLLFVLTKLIFVVVIFDEEGQIYHSYTKNISYAVEMIHSFTTILIRFLCCNVIITINENI